MQNYIGRIGKVLWMLPVLLLAIACQPVGTSVTAANGATSSGARLVVYSGRSENLVAPIIDTFAEQSGIQVEVRYGGTSELAATILEEGDNSPADVFFAQDAGALGALSKSGRLAPLSAETLAMAPKALESRNGDWVGVSGRARVLVYNTSQYTAEQLPDDIWGLTDEEWRGRIGWAPTNASFQSFVTALRVLEGDARAQQWLAAMIANDVQAYDSNAAIVEATAAGEIGLGLVNHYYLYRFLAEQGETFTARNYHFRTPHAGSMINVAGVGVLNSAKNAEAAAQFVRFLLSKESQQYFADQTFEYPLTGDDVTVPDMLTPLNGIAAPDLDLSAIDDLEGTLALLQSVGALDQ